MADVRGEIFALQLTEVKENGELGSRMQLPEFLGFTITNNAQGSTITPWADYQIKDFQPDHPSEKAARNYLVRLFPPQDGWLRHKQV